MGSYAEQADELLAGQPDCQRPASDTHCQPGCEHERLMVARGIGYALLDLGTYLDRIAASLRA